MGNLILTMLPIVLTFTVAAWSSPTAEAQPRSAISNNPAETCATRC